MKYRTLQKETGMKGPLLAFWIALAGAAAIFIPFLIVDKGFFLYCGDYNAQQIPFYLHVSQFLKEGGGTWSWATDLGTSIVSGYSFYNIGSPFLWLSMLFPTRWIPFLMAPMLMLKFACIAAAACLYLSRYARTRNMAVICALAYAFSGFNTYNIFFNHMLEPAILFPLMLWALDGYMYQRRRGFFALTVGLSLLNSYFFFVGNVVFLLIYFVVKLIKGEYRISARDFGFLALEALLGVGIGMVLALPSYFSLILNPRTATFADGLNTVLYWHVHQYANILKSIFLPPDPPYLANLFPEGVINWTSMSAFLPIVSVGGVAAYLKSRPRSGTKLILFICFVMAMVPILNSSFYAFNSSYYARWYYMPLLLMCFATLRSLEDPEIDLRYGAKVSLALTAVWIVFALIPTEKDGAWVLGAAKVIPQYWLTLGLGLLSAGLFYLLVRHYRKTVKFAPLLLAVLMGYSVAYTVIHISLGKFPQWTRDGYLQQEMYYDQPEIDLPDDQFYRTDSYNAYENLGLWFNLSNLQCFQSTVNPSIMEFYPSVGVKRDVSSKPDVWKYELRGLLSVRYTLVPTREQSAFEQEVDGLGWRFWQTQGSYAIYENENFVPLGFTYDSYVLLDDLHNAPEDTRAPLLMRAVGLTAEQLEYDYLFSEGRMTLNSNAVDPVTGEYGYDAITYDQYVEDASARRASASYETSADASGFTSKILLDEQQMVFFAVPYDDGFTATVNGQQTEILKVSGGMMAVVAPAGDNEIVFQYRTPGLRVGAAISILSLVLTVLYMVLATKADQRRRQRKALRAATLADGTPAAEGGNAQRAQTQEPAHLFEEQPPPGATPPQPPGQMPAGPVQLPGGEGYRQPPPPTPPQNPRQKEE